MISLTMKTRNGLKDASTTRTMDGMLRKGQVGDL